MRRSSKYNPAHGIRKGTYLLAGTGVCNERKKHKKENVGA